LYDISKIEGCYDKLQYSLRDYKYIPEKLRKEWYNLLNTPSNFLKHANRDPEGVLSFDPKMTHSILLDSTMLLENLTKEIFYEAIVNRLWFFVKYPSVLSDSAYKDSYSKLSLDTFNPDDLKEFRRLIKDNKAFYESRKIK